MVLQNGVLEKFRHEMGKILSDGKYEPMPNGFLCRHSMVKEVEFAQETSFYWNHGSPAKLEDSGSKW